jgi:nicotinamide-nucleotide amidase
MRTVEIVCLGNELLIGKTVNTNSNEISKFFTINGFDVIRVTTIKDQKNVGVNLLREIYERRPDIVCITGGLGPTYDDIQLEIVSESIDKRLIINDNALRMIQQKYKFMNESREKMAYLPEGSTALNNDIGTAPGVYTVFNDIDIISLPGVPKEMRYILKSEVLKILNDKYPARDVLTEMGIDIKGVRESDIAEMTIRMKNKYPKFYFKSHPRVSDGETVLSLHVYGVTKHENDVVLVINDWLEIINNEFEITELTKIKKMLK